MKFAALALDFDGTIAQHDRLDPEVRQAIGELRAQDIVVILVTGRILSDLRRVAGDLHFVDAVVAENGAVIEFPCSGHTSALAPPPNPRLLEALRRGGIAHVAGQAIIDADASSAPRILEAIRRLELPLSLLFNRSRVMVLPQNVSKATGLGRALTILRLSPHNTVGIGDAENDHELLQTCELGVAVGWGSEVLKAAADHVLPGEGPRAVAGYIRHLASLPQVPAPRQTRRRLLIGHTDLGEPLSLAVRDRNVLIAGDPRSGKSWVTGLLCEQLILYGYCLCVIDPEGDYAALEALPGVAVLGGADPLPRPRELLRRLRHPDASVVIDLSHASHEEKVAYVRSVLPGLARMRRQTGLPHRVVVDEAHYFLHEPDVAELVDLERSGYTFTTFQASRVHPAVLAGTGVVIVTRESDRHEVAALFERYERALEPGALRDWEERLDALTTGEAMVLPLTEESGGMLQRVRLAPRLTPHVRHLTKYVDIPVPRDRGFVFWQGGAPRTRARTLREFATAVEQLPLDALTGHLQRGDFSRWVADVFGDYPLADEMCKVEAAHRGGATAAAALAVSQAIRARYHVMEPGLPRPHTTAPPPSTPSTPAPDLDRGRRAASLTLA